MRPFLGIIPAAGTGSRLKPSRYPKELLPVEYHWDEEQRGVVPRLVIERSLELMRTAGVGSCTIVTSAAKPELLRYLGSGAHLGIRLAYMMQEEARGLARAVGGVCDWAAAFDINCCLALPDTIPTPDTAMLSIVTEVHDGEADLVLGVFPTETPEELGPVEIAPDGRVVRVLDKPAHTNLRNTWAIAAWTPAFSRLLTQELSGDGSEEVVLGHIFDRACHSGLHVRAVEFRDGFAPDIGTRTGLANVLARHAIIMPAADLESGQVEELPAGVRRWPSA